MNKYRIVKNEHGEFIPEKRYFFGCVPFWCPLGFFGYSSIENSMKVIEKLKQPPIKKPVEVIWKGN